MKEDDRLDVAVVRFLPFFLFIISGIDIYARANDIDMGGISFLHGYSVLYPMALFLISLSNKKYHCSYNRLCYVFLIIFPIVNYIDVQFDIIKDSCTYIIIIATLYAICTIGSFLLCVWHFIKVVMDKVKIE